jgi:hypothetical protein
MWQRFPKLCRRFEFDSAHQKYRLVGWLSLTAST